MKHQSELREYIPYNYLTYTGKRLCKAHVDSYNIMQDEINSRINAGFPVDDEMLNRSHRLFVTFANC